MLSSCKLNNKSMRNLRREQTYQCLVIDLAMLGVITRQEGELLLGSGIPDGLCLPDGSNAINDKVNETADKTIDETTEDEE